MRNYKHFGLLTLIVAPVVANMAFRAAPPQEAVAPVENGAPPPVGATIMAPAAPMSVSATMPDPSTLTEGIDPAPALDPTPPGGGDEPPPPPPPPPLTPAPSAPQDGVASAISPAAQSAVMQAQ